MNQRKPITAEQIKEYEDARLIIADESSFAKGSELVKFHQQMSALKQMPNKKYGELKAHHNNSFQPDLLPGEAGANATNNVSKDEIVDAMPRLQGH